MADAPVQVETPRQVYVAAIANLIVALSKFIVAVITTSSAMLADTGDQLLMVLGIKRSRKAPDEEHPFGYGMEIYFWGFMVAIVLFSIGGGVSVYEGVLKLRSSHEISNVGWNYIFLALRQLQKQHPYATHSKYFESLCGRESTGGMRSGRLLGESADREVIDEICKIVSDDPIVVAGRRPMMMHFAPDQILVNMEVKFDPKASSDKIIESIGTTETRIRERLPNVRHIFIEAESWKRRDSHREAA